MNRIVLALVLISGCTATDPTATIESPARIGPGALLQFAGPWLCMGQYLSPARAFSASRVVTVSDDSIIGDYQETQSDSPIHVNEQLTALTKTTGTWTFNNSTGNYALMLVDTRHISNISFTGVNDQGLSFAEELEMAGDTYSLTISIAGTPFKIENCIRQVGE